MEFETERNSDHHYCHPLA